MKEKAAAPRDAGSRLGPYSDPTADFEQRSGRYTGLVLSGNIYIRVLRAVQNMRVVSAYQLSLLFKKSSGRVRGALKALFKEGYLDRLAVGASPPLYVLGPEGCRVLQEQYTKWEVLPALRAAAANQLCVVLGAESWEIFPGTGLDCRVCLGGGGYAVLCPRMGEAEIERCVNTAGLLGPDEKLIVVAVSLEAAAAIAGKIKPGIPVRYTWDRGLGSFYRFVEGAGLVLSEVLETAAHKKQKFDEKTTKKGLTGSQ